MSHRSSPPLVLHLLVAGTITASACRTRLVESEAPFTPLVVTCSDPILVGVKLKPSVLWVGTGDFNGDGKPDLVGASEGISFTFGRGDGTFGPATDPVQTGQRTYAAIADFDGDGVDDVVTNQATDSMKLYRGIRGVDAPSFSDATGVSGITSGWTAAGDIDGDGRPDVASLDSMRSGVTLWHGTGSGRFDMQQFPVFVRSARGFVALRDLDRDRHAELLTPIDSGVWAQSGYSFVTDMVVTHGTVLPAPVDSLVTADFDEDGVPDLAAVATLTAGSNVFVAHGNGDGTFAAPASLRAGQNPHAAVAVDWNVDGHLDLAVANSGADHTVTFLYGRGDGTFSDPQHCFAVTFEANGGPNWITTADFNRDGRPDLAFAYHDGLDVVLNQLR